MASPISGRPEPSEYLAYYDRYIQLVAADDAVAARTSQIGPALATLSRISEQQSAEPRPGGKWSLRQTFGHLNDTERVFAYRALRFARGDSTELPGFEPEEYVAKTDFHQIPWRHILDEMAAVREASLALFRPLDQQAWMRGGLAGGHFMTVRALAFNIAGHELHHLRLI